MLTGLTEVAGVGRIGDELWPPPPRASELAAELPALPPILPPEWCDDSECEFKKELWCDLMDWPPEPAPEDAEFADDLLLLLLLLLLDFAGVPDEFVPELPLPLELFWLLLLFDELRFEPEFPPDPTPPLLPFELLREFDCCCCCSCWRHLARRFLNQTCTLDSGRLIFKATSSRIKISGYRVLPNSDSNTSNCARVNVVRSRLCLRVLTPHIPWENPTASKPWGNPKGPSDGIGMPGGNGPCGTEWWGCGPP